MMIDLRSKNIKKNNKKNWVKPNSRTWYWNNLIEKKKVNKQKKLIFKKQSFKYCVKLNARDAINKFNLIKN
jgi:hypothetical protein